MYQYNISKLDRVLSGLNCYQDIRRVRYDIELVLRQIPSLQPSSGTLTHNNGTSSTLLHLVGTIPIFYNSNQYNIPLEIWLLEAYPYVAPQCYVRPTSEMMVKPGHANVDPNGLVILPYLSSWNANTHTLVELIAHQCSVFGDHPPVFRKPPQGVSPYPYSHQPTQQYQPQFQQGMIQQQAPYGSGQSQSFNGPNHTNTTTGSGMGAGMAGGMAGTMAGGMAGYGAAANFTPPNPRKEYISELTKQMQHEQKKVYKRIQEEMDSQFEMQVQLAEGKTKLEQGVESMNILRSTLISETGKTKKRIDELTVWLEDPPSMENVDVDEILVPGDSLSRQMLDIYAEYQAIDDALYYMDRALSNGEIELNTFLKEVRKLSRKQFMKLALMKKIVEMQEQMRREGYAGM